MPEGITDEEKQIIKRVVPSAQNKILAAAMVRLYVAYPNRSKWTYTGLQGAIVLANDLIGNTFWIKLVDVSPSSRGVLWDQEIYEHWSYNQDRVFFHSFEIENCLAGLSFSDEKEAKKFLKKMADREKYASKSTKAQPFGGAPPAHHKHGIFGAVGGLFGHRHVSQPTMPTPPPPQVEPARTFIPPSLAQNSKSSSSNGLGSGHSSEYAKLDALDPNWRETWGGDLREMGITDDQIRDNQEFIADYIREQQQQASGTVPHPPPPPTAYPLPAPEPSRPSPPPPPPPPPAAPHQRASPPLSHSSSLRGAPPAPPAPRQAPKAEPAPQPPKEPTPPAREPTPPTRQRFAVPPPLADAGKLANIDHRRNTRPHSSSVSNPGPPPPPRPPKVANDDFEPGEHGSRHGVPPPFAGGRSPAPPSTPSRGAVPPPPPPRGSARSAAPSYPERAHAVPPANMVPPPLPPKTPNAPAAGPPPLPPMSSRPTPSLPARDAPAPPQLPPPPARSAASAPPMPPPMPPPSGGAPPPPPMPPGPPPLPAGGFGGPSAPPPPPPPPPGGIGGPPGPPPPAGGAAPALPPVTGDRSNLLAGIQSAGGVRALKKVDRSKVKDRSAAMVPGTENSAPASGGGSTPSSGGGGGLQDALQAALNKRKQKVSASDDERDKSDDDW